MAQNPLPFNMDVQECSEWCWAAVVSSIAVFVSSNLQPQQCQVVDREAFSPSFPSPGCCDKANRCLPKNSTCVCNTTGPIGTALADYDLITGNLNGQIPSPSAFRTITQEIDNCCVVVLELTEQAHGIAHVVVAYGYSGTDNLMISDPLNGSSRTCSFSDLLDASEAGMPGWSLSRIFTTVSGQC